MRVRTDEKGKVIATENITAAPESGLYCARDANGVPVSEAGRVQEGRPPAEPPRSARAKTPASAAIQE